MAKDTAEREFWDWTHGKEKKTATRKLNKNFRRMFDSGHRYSLRTMVRVMTDEEWRKKLIDTYQGGFLKQIHPRAFALLAKYGRSFSPLKIREHIGPEPDRGACYANAYIMMRALNSGKKSKRRTALYVEGIVYGVLVDPMLHAWTTSSTNMHQAFDWSMYASAPWHRYFGIVLSEREHLHAMKLCHKGEFCASLMLNQKYFPLVETYLERILKRRSKQNARH